MSANSPGESGLHPETLAVVRGRETGPGSPLNVPPVLASTFRDGPTARYGRWGNPTWEALEAALGALEGGDALAFSSGQAAVAAVLDGVPPDGVVVHPTAAYTGTRELLGVLAEAGRLSLRSVDITDTGAVLDAIAGAAMLWIESPTNPLLGIADVRAIVSASNAAGVDSVVDNTFATPVAQQPLGWGATFVVHSATKYIGGHSDLLLGVAVTRDAARREALARHRTLHGAIPGTLEAFLALRGLRTLPVRFARQQDTAAFLAGRLLGHRAVSRVRYPGLPDDPHHARAASQMSGFGAIVSFEMPSADAADAVVAAVELAVPTTSLGGVETTIERARPAPRGARRGGALKGRSVQHPPATVRRVNVVGTATPHTSCRICCAPASRGYSMCTSCRDVAVALRRPPVPVNPVALVARSSPLYRALRQYKSGESAVAARQSARLARLLDAFFTEHAARIAPGGLDACAVVPSPRAGRPPPHPLAAVVAATGSLPPTADVLAAGDADITHRRPAPAGYRVSTDASGARLLLVDDVYTSGAHFQSAAAALWEAGARAVHGLVIGRFVPEATTGAPHVPE